MLKVKVGIQKDPIPLKIQEATVILDKIEDNPAFPKAQPLIAPLRAKVEALRAKATQANAADSTKKQLFSEQDQLNVEVDGELLILCNDINAEAAGDETKLMGSGFEMAKEAEVAQTPSALTDFSLTRGDYPGIVDGHCHSDKRARAYESRFIVGALPEGAWTAGPTFFNSKFEWTGFDSGERVWICVRAAGTGGAGPWSDALSIVVP